jgi:hypothetical protein
MRGSQACQLSSLSMGGLALVKVVESLEIEMEVDMFDDVDGKERREKYEAGRVVTTSKRRVE